MINLKTFNLDNELINNNLLSEKISRFWTEVFSEIKDKHLLILCKVKFEDSDLGYRTLGHLVIVNYEDRENFLNYLSQRLSILNDSYISVPISQMTFSYVIKDGKSLDDKRTLLLQEIDDKEIVTHNFNNMNLPITMDPFKYGRVLVSNLINENGESFERFIVENGNKTYQIDVGIGGRVNKVSILGNIKLSWVDSLIDNENPDYFKREIGKSTIYFLDGEIILRKKELPAKAFKKLNKEETLKNEFNTLDIETITNENGQVRPYLINLFNGKEHITSFSNNEDQLFKDFFDKLLVRLENGCKEIIYAHNLSSFDGILLFKHLFTLGKINPLYFNGRLISIKLVIKSKDSKLNKTLIFKDSYLLIPNSLRNISQAFQVSSQKGHFPYNLHDINYVGVFPPFKQYWTDITNKEWSHLKQAHGRRLWNFKLESIKYCQLDCESLHQVISIFNENIFNEFKINIHKPLTLPALTMKVFKTHFMKKDQIFQTLGKIEFDIRKSYTGGAVDVYIPHNSKISTLYKQDNLDFKPLNYYDVNSLYPFVMANNSMPIGKAITFEGDIRKYEPDAFGFFYCKINSPEYLEHPILQRRIHTRDGIRTIAGLGSWEGWIFSEEMDNAVAYGYTFEILKGYEFKKEIIFKEYMEKLYNLRLQYPKSHPMNFIAKLLMNSLYGKFGMRLESIEIQIFDCSIEEGEEHFIEMFKHWAESIIDFHKIGNYKILIRNTLMPYKYNEELDMFHGIDINIGIASAVTAYARNYMSKFKNNPKFTLYYSDTDSIIIEEQLPNELIGNKIGQFKLEHKINKAVFLAPKTYGFIDKDGKQIIKIKGLSTKVTDQFDFDTMWLLLEKGSSQVFKQKKWMKKVIQGNIRIVDQLYHLKITSNKRNYIYNSNNIFTSTKPLYYKNIK